MLIMLKRIIIRNLGTWKQQNMPMVILPVVV